MIAAVIFLDLILIRHFWCLYVCPYGLYQYLFHHPRTMRVGFDEKRQTDCIGCNRCTDSCFMGVEPRLTKVFTRCINCGDCIVACDDVAAKKGFQPLLNFTFERDDVSHAEIGGSIIGRTAWPLAIFSVAAAFFSYGVYTYQPVRLQVSQVSWSAAAVPGSEGRGSEQMNGREGDYLVEVFNKSPKTQHWALAVSGLPKDAVVFARETVTLPGGTSEKVVLRIRENHPLLHPETPYPFEVMVRDPRTSGPVLSEHTVYYPMSWRG
jgi:polyferredoxin